MKLLNIIYTNAMPDSVEFYEALGLHRKEDGDVNTWWNEFVIGDASLALHWNQGEPLPTSSNPELHFQIESADFDTLYESLAPLNPGEITSLQGLNRTFTVTDPNGVAVHLNEVK